MHAEPTCLFVCAWLFYEFSMLTFLVMQVCISTPEASQKSTFIEIWSTFVTTEYPSHPTLNPKLKNQGERGNQRLAKNE